MSRRLVFHYARPERDFDGWDLVARDATVGARQDGPLGVVWHAELPDDATVFTYRLQRPVTKKGTASDQGQYGGTTELETDPKGNQDQTVLIEQDHTEVLYPSGFTKGKKAYTLPITPPDVEHQAIRETLNRLIIDVGGVRDGVANVDSKVDGLDGKSDFLVAAAGDIDGKVGVLDNKSDVLRAAAGDLDNKVGILDSKSDFLIAAAGEIDGKVTVLDGKNDSIRTAVADIGDDVDKLLSRGGVIVFGRQTQAPDDVEQLAGQAVGVVSDLVIGLETARETFAAELHVPSIPSDSPAVDARGQAVQQIIAGLFFAQLAAQEQRGRLQQLVDDDAASGAQDLVALRAQLIATADQIDRELVQVQVLTQSDPADLELNKTLGDEVRTKLIQLRVLAAEVAP
jgi:hypothetical protein